MLSVSVSHGCIPIRYGQRASRNAQPLFDLSQVPTDASSEHPAPIEDHRVYAHWRTMSGSAAQRKPPDRAPGQFRL